ncbi:hypothetical protein KC878_03350, partial [Candidatus Saccharibacteria bacterium]|nr:hypothetical protein [Candidatus Saccharibacteria bacterium]
MDYNQASIENLTIGPNSFVLKFKSWLNKIFHSPTTFGIVVLVILGAGFVSFRIVAGTSISGSLNKKNPIRTHSIHIDASGRLKVTVKDSGGRRSDSVRFKLRLLDSEAEELESYQATRKGEPVTIESKVTPGDYYLELSAVESLSRRGTRYTFEIEYPTANAETSSDTEAPTISITMPKSGEVLEGDATISGKAYDNKKVSSVTYRFAGGAGQIATGTTNWVGLLDTTTQPNGPATIIVRAKDAAGNKAEATLSVIIDNPDATTPSDQGDGSGSTGGGDTGTTDPGTSGSTGGGDTGTTDPGTGGSTQEFPTAYTTGIEAGVSLTAWPSSSYRSDSVPTHTEQINGKTWTVVENYNINLSNGNYLYLVASNVLLRNVKITANSTPSNTSALVQGNSPSNIWLDHVE